jgi:cell division transport system permease protein
MAKSKKKVDSKIVSQQKRHRRQWVTFLRMCRYGVNNFTRNAWLTIAATAIMTITLLVVFVSFISHNVLVDTVDQLRDKVTMSIYLKTDTSQEDVTKAVSEIKQLSSVTAVTVKSPEDARADFVQQNKQDSGTLDAVKEATNRFPWTLNVKILDINDTSQLATIVKSNKAVSDHIDPNRDPSFAGSRRSAIETIGRAANFAQKLGIIASAIFVSISMLIIFNTIRMAIFNRREEIQMMKLIGAERSFIRGPFLVEAIVYGFFAALIATGIGFALLILSAPTLQSYEISIGPTLQLMTYYSGFVLLAMIGIGALIGVISSLLATRRYLKV